jgi:DNA-binding transcriptional ArsR family regulator
VNENIEREMDDSRTIEDFTGPAEGEGPVSLDRILSAVADEHRRAILDSLDSASDETLEYGALVDHVADRVGGEHADDEHRRRVRIALRHAHLPKLEEARMIEYEDETGHVRFVGGELVRDILTLVGSHDVTE